MSARDRSVRLHSLLVVVTLLPAFACGPSEESKQMQKVAGIYFQTSHDTAYARRMGDSEQLILRSNGVWVRTAFWTTRFNDPPAVDSGTYRANGATIAIRFSARPKTYVVKGDTLMWLTSERDLVLGREEALTGRKLNQVETFYVKMR